MYCIPRSTPWYLKANSKLQPQETHQVKPRQTEETDTANPNRQLKRARQTQTDRGNGHGKLRQTEEMDTTNTDRQLKRSQQTQTDSLNRHSKPRQTEETHTANPDRQRKCSRQTTNESAEMLHTVRKEIKGSGENRKIMT